eukprot:scaffold22146_cov25-Prasinocladus_malaysianus.AAC.2
MLTARHAKFPSSSGLVSSSLSSWRTVWRIERARFRTNSTGEASSGAHRARNAMRWDEGLQPANSTMRPKPAREGDEGNTGLDADARSGCSTPRPDLLRTHEYPQRLLATSSTSNQVSKSNSNISYLSYSPGLFVWTCMCR